MTSDANRTLQAVFARIGRQNPDPSTIDQQIINAFERLMLGRPEITDGSLTVTSICTEAGISRASYYRSPVAAIIKQALENPTVQRPEVETLKAEISKLKKAERKLRSDRAAEIRELTDTKNTYANQIQVLTLRNAELEEDNRRLQHRLESLGDNIEPL